MSFSTVRALGLSVCRCRQQGELEKGYRHAGLLAWGGHLACLESHALLLFFVKETSLSIHALRAVISDL